MRPVRTARPTLKRGSHRHALLTLPDSQLTTPHVGRPFPIRNTRPKSRTHLPSPTNIYPPPGSNEKSSPNHAMLPSCPPPRRGSSTERTRADSGTTFERSTTLSSNDSVSFSHAASNLRSRGLGSELASEGRTLSSPAQSTTKSRCGHQSSVRPSIPHISCPQLGQYNSWRPLGIWTCAIAAGTFSSSVAKLNQLRPHLPCGRCPNSKNSVPARLRSNSRP
jgi:hypothetical protein